eukprot:scaffold39328_cov21-Tisochrysis_lutea.AAC.1
MLQGKAKKHRSELDKYNDPDGTGVDELHYQMMQWDAFAQAWDEIIDDLREADLVSNKEASGEYILGAGDAPNLRSLPDHHRHPGAQPGRRQPDWRCACT